jgi:hypothetical protein
MQLWWIFGEHDLHNIRHNFGIQLKVKFDHNNPNSFIESNNTKVFIQTSHDAEFLDHLTHYVQTTKAHHTYSLSSLDPSTKASWKG